MIPWHLKKKLEIDLGLQVAHYLTPTVVPPFHQQAIWAQFYEDYFCS